MDKEDVEWEFESRCRVAMNYSCFRYVFFFKLNIALCVLSMVSLWCSGYFADGKCESAFVALNIVGSALLVFDVVLNLVGCCGFWKSMRDGYFEFFAEFQEIRFKASAEELRGLMSRFVKFDSRCDASFNALGLIAWNDACIQMGKAEHVKHVPWYKCWTANIFSWGSVSDNFG